MIDPEFYVGYLPNAPPRLAAAVRRIVLGLFALAATLAVALVFAQRPFPLSTFEFQNYREFQGMLREHPYPRLAASSQYLLVAPGKHGAADVFSGLDGKTLRLKGSLIYRNGDKMIEALPSTILPVDHAAASEPVRVDLGMVTLAGEIVDSKCYLGVMNPGAGKVHRDCAARCISGGIPPALIVKDSSGVSKTILLTGLTIRRLLDFVAEPVEVRGRLLQSDGVLILDADRLARRE